MKHVAEFAPTQSHEFSEAFHSIDTESWQTDRQCRGMSTLDLSIDKAYVVVS
jgi:hypothetical protein